MDISLPQVNPGKLAKSYIKRVAKRKVEPIAEAIGERGIRGMVEKNISILEFFEPVLEDDEKCVIVFGATYPQMRANAQANPWISHALSDEDVADLLPDWCQTIIATYGEKGEAWLKAQVPGLRQFFA